MKIYRIANWGTRFENNRTRELKKLDWVPTPNRHDGDGYVTLLAMKNGESLFGAWNAILQVASRCGIPADGCGIPAAWCSGRGVLLRDSGKPHDSTSLAARTRFSEATIKQALETLSSDDIGWLEYYENTNENAFLAGGCENPAAKPQEGITEGKGREGNRREEKTPKKSATPPVEIPENLSQSAGFLEAWGRWMDHLKEKRKPATAHAKTLQLRKLAAMGPDKAIATLNNCIEHNWQGIYDDNTARNTTSNPRNAGITTDPAKQSAGIMAELARRRQREAAAKSLAEQVAQTRQPSPADSGNGGQGGGVLRELV